ncbi:MAG: T9SS type A sorting domain-containing protein [Flavipsychrobacter sp.]
MKKNLYLLLSLLLLSTTSIAQPYKSIFGDSTSMWTCSYSGLATHSIAFFAKGDTTVRGETYKKVGFSGNSYPLSFLNTTLGLLREDTATGKVWYRSQPKYKTNAYSNPARDTVDILIMDMTLQLGDTFYTGKVSGMGQDTMAIVDSVYIDTDNRKHIRFNKKIGWNLNLEFIERVGTTLGIAYKDSNVISSFAENGGLICCFHDSVNIYSTILKTNLNNKCIPTVGIKHLSKKQLLTHPNPSTGVVTINVPTLASTHIVVANIAGQLVYTRTISNSRQISIDLTTQPKGIYTIRLTNQQHSYTNKLILE